MPTAYAYEKSEELEEYTVRGMGKMDRTTVSFLEFLGRRLNHSFDLRPHQYEVFIFRAMKLVQPRVVRIKINCSLPEQRG